MRLRLIQMTVGLVSALAFAAALAAFAGEPARTAKAKAAVHVVHIRNMLFVPQTLEIAPGDAVTWVNDDIFLHAVKPTEAGASWQSADVAPHASWTKAFSASAHYICPYHPTMTGEIVVRAAK